MKYFIIKRKATGSSPTPYYKEKDTWTSQWEDAERFPDAVDAEYNRKRVKDDGKDAWICEVELIEKEVTVQTQALGSRQDGPGFGKRNPGLG